MDWATAGFLRIAKSVASPGTLKPLTKTWMALAIVFGWIITRRIPVLLFYLVVTHTGLVARLFGRDFMDRKVDRAANSNWQKRDEKSFDPRDYKRQL